MLLVFMACYCALQFLTVRIAFTIGRARFPGQFLGIAVGVLPASILSVILDIVDFSYLPSEWVEPLFQAEFLGIMLGWLSMRRSSN